MKHKWVEDGVSMHNGQYYYKCTVCGKTDWIASYGTLEQLDNGRDCPVDLHVFWLYHTLINWRTTWPTKCVTL